MSDDDGMEAWQQHLQERRQSADLNLGHDHYLHWMGSQSGEQKIGAIIMHRAGLKGTETGWCVGGVQFNGTQHQKDHHEGRPFWDVLSLDPLTISPSVLCSCGDHGFIQNGKWIPA